MEEKDTMKIRTSFFKDLVSKVIKKILKQKFGMDVNFSLGEFEMDSFGGKTYFHISCDASIKNEDICKIVEESLT